MRAVVVGGGPAGCAAARRLRELGHEVVLLEAQAHLGGRSWTLREDGYTIDSGAFMIGTAFTRTSELIENSGRMGAVETFEPSVGLRDGSRFCLLRPNSFRNFFALPLLDWRTKVRVMLRAASLPQDLFDERGTARADKGESAAAWARRCFGDDGYEYAIRPMVEFAGVPAEDLTSAFAARLLRINWRMRMLRLGAGMGSFAESLVEAVDVRLDEPVEAVEPANGGVRVSTADGVHTVDAAVIATDAAKAGDLLASPDVKRALDRIEYLPVVHASIGFGTDPWPQLDAHWVMPVGSGDHAVGLAGLLARRSPAAVPEGAQVVDLYFSRDASARLGDREALEHARGALSALLGAPAPKPLFEHLFRFPRGLPVLRPGTVSKVASLKGAVGGRIALAGDYMAYPSVETAVRSGEGAADRVHADALADAG